MAVERHAEQTTLKDFDTTTAIGIDPSSTSESDGDHGIHFVSRGQELGDASSSHESIDGYDPELMSGRTLLTAEEEKKLLRKIDWRLMTLCSIIFMFKNLDSANVRTDPPTGGMMQYSSQLRRHPTLES
jgi:hypothetical protein